MSDNASLTTNRDDRVAEVLDAYLEAMKAGVPPDLDELLARYPDLAEDLKECLASLAFIRQAEKSANGSADEGADMPNADDSGGVLGDFRIVREVGKGGMGVVYEAEQISLRRRVALKVLPFAATLDARQLQRFHNEAQAAACLHHTNIVPVFSVGSERGVHFYAMQFIDGQPLSELIRQMRQREKKAPTVEGGDPTIAYPSPVDAASTPLPAADLTPLTGEGRRTRGYFRKVAELGVQAAEALDHAHQLGIVHRDIKPANLLLDGRGNLWVTDFGLAHVQHGEASLTLTGQAVGTPRYMSPEQALAKRVPIDHRTDVYSLGVTLYELLTLRPAFASEDRQELLRQIAFDDPSRPRRLERTIPAELEVIVLKAMEKRPQDRYATAQELADDLRRWLHDQPIRARRPSWVQVGRKWLRRHQAVVWSAVVCTLLIVAVIGASIGWIAGDRAARRAEAGKRFDEAVLQGITSLQEEKWLEAKVAARRTADLLVGVGDDPVRQQRLQQLKCDLKMAETLELIRLQKAEVKDGHFDDASAAPAYAAAFDDYNLPVLELEPEEAAPRIEASAIREQVLAALVDWHNVHPDPTEKKKIVELIRSADRNPWRLQVWDALDHQEGAKLAQLAQSVEALDQPPGRLETLGDILARFDKPAAVRFLRQAQQRHPDDFWISHQLASFLRRMEPPQLEEAIGYYRAALALRSHSPGVHLNLGNALKDKGQFDEAIVEYREAIRIKKDYAQAHNNLGLDLRDKGQLDEAIVEYREAIRIKKDYAQAHSNLGNALRDKGQLDEAIAECREAIRLEKDFADAHGNLGNALRDKGELDEAIAEYREDIRYREATSRKKDIAVPHNNLGITLSAKGQLDEAITELREAVRLKKDSAEIHNNLGDVLHKKGQLDEAITELREAIRLKKDFAEAHYNLGLDLRAKGQLDEAIAEYRAAIRSKNDFAKAHYCLGNALGDKGEVEEAIAEFREAIRIKEDFAEAHCNLGALLEKKGKFTEALVYRRRGHKLGSKNPRWPYPSAQWVRNCERLVEVDGKLSAILSGPKQPADLAERLDFAQFCVLPCKKRYADAVRFFRQAFEEEPKLADDLNTQHRYNAACAAALAGCGQGQDADKLNAEERARLRQQALDWLWADLKAYCQLMEKSAGKAGPIAQRMQHWLQDTDFAGVSRDESLARLAEAERKDWHKLWEEVETLRQRATKQTKTASSARP